MRFLIRRKRPAPAVIIVALIDVLIVLVIFLLVTTSFKQPPAFRLSLPESTQATKAGANQNPPIVVSIDAQGMLRMSPNNLPVTLEQFNAQLQEEARKNPQVQLAIRADKNAPWGKIVSIMDAASAAHIKVLSAFTKQANPS